MTDKFTIGRRTLLGGVAGAAAFGLTGGANAQKPLVVGFIYVGPRDDYGYNQAHAEAAALLKKMPGVKVVEEEKVPETVAVEKTMESMINLDGATLVFPTSFGYFDPHMLKMAAKFPKIQFRHCGGLWTQGKHPMNTGSYFGYIDEAQYLSGIVAGYTSKSGKIGFVAAKPIPQVLRNINAFTMGAQSVNPKITCQAIFTGDWSLPVKEAEATNSMIAQGVDVVTCHVDSPKVVIETAERAGIYTCGYHTNQPPSSPDGIRLRRRPMRERARALIDAYHVKTPGPDAAIRGLSGGNVQRAVLARELSSEGDLLIVANPCFGLDFAAVAEIRTRIVEARNRGAAVLLVSEDLDEILQLSDRIVVMFDGKLALQIDGAQADVGAIGRAMAGH